jgi:hypothetical protein
LHFLSCKAALLPWCNFVVNSYFGFMQNRLTMPLLQDF